MKIITNNVPREVLYPWQLTKEELTQFDEVNEDDTFVRYRGTLYPMSDFVMIVPRSQQRGFAHGADEGSPLLQWHGILTDSFFSGVVVRYCDDHETVVVGLALS